MTTTDLDGPLLRSVSRSFYLSIRLLPQKLRAPVGLAYLLARASDTIADSADLPAIEREKYLAAFLAMVRTGGREGLAEIREHVRSPHAGENELIAQLDRCLAWLESLPEFDRAEIRDVLGKIIRGQTLDVQRPALNNDAELEEYCYLVAGCVGEFWTRVCVHHLPGYSSLPPDRLNALAGDFGKALQLVNILRDLPEDVRAGRRYLRPDDFARWHERAVVLLESGREYIRSVRPARVRAGCFLPWDLARKTLALLTAPPSHRIKVPRSAVRATLCRTLLAALSNAPLR
ncbi:MAG: phytoene/squalene synthase family protein [Chthoniobacteraceae bacterium]